MPTRPKTDSLIPDAKAEIYALYQKGLKLTEIADAVNELLKEQGEDAILNKDNIHRMLKKREASFQRMEETRQISEMLVNKFGDNANIEKQTDSIVLMGQSLIMELMAKYADENDDKNPELKVARLASASQDFIGTRLKQQNFREKITKAEQEKIATALEKQTKNAPAETKKAVEIALLKLGIRKSSNYDAGETAPFTEA